MRKLGITTEQLEAAQPSQKKMGKRNGKTFISSFLINLKDILQICPISSLASQHTRVCVDCGRNKRGGRIVRF